MPDRRTLFSASVLVLVGLQVLVVFVSWIFYALDLGIQVRSLLDGDGLRWLFRTLDDNILQPMLAWIVLLSMGGGALCESGLFRRKHHKSVRTSFALGVVAVESLLFVLFFGLLCLLPHAVLADATGHLLTTDMLGNTLVWVAVLMTVIGFTYALFAETISSLPQMFDILVAGIRRSVPFIVLYMLCAELCASVCYVFFLE